MNANMTRFSDAVYHRKDKYDFGMTVFTRRELKVLLLIDGERTVADISSLLSTDDSPLMPEFAKLVKLGLIQTEGGIISADNTDVIFNEAPELPAEYTITRLPLGIPA